MGSFDGVCFGSFSFLIILSFPDFALLKGALEILFFFVIYFSFRGELEKSFLKQPDPFDSQEIYFVKAGKSFSQIEYQAQMDIPIGNHSQDVNLSLTLSQNLNQALPQRKSPSQFPPSVKVDVSNWDPPLG